FDVDNMKLSDNGVLLFVYGKKRGNNWYKDPYPCISVYFADHGNKFTTYKYHDKKVIIDSVYLIASDIGARLLIVCHQSLKNKEANFHFSICDPFAPYIPGKSYVKADELFKDVDVKFDNNFENKFIIKDDKIIGFNNDGTLVIKKLIPGNWISYLRRTLKDSNSIFISSVRETIIDLIRRTKEEVTTNIDKSKENTEKSKYFVTWTLEYENTLNDRMCIILTAKLKNNETKTDSIQIVPESYINSGKDVKEYIKEWDCLDNDDLVIVTALGVLIWTFNTKDKIELNYRWDYEGEIDEKTLDEKNFDKKNFKERYFLPAPSYFSVIHYSPAFIQSSDESRFFFNELIEKHINNKFFLILYGQKLIENIVKENKDTWLRKLLDGCIEQIEEDDETLNTQIFNIFSRSIFDIYKKNPSFFDDLL
ncbi:303_t:CDS:2, partial [Gigaspora margarita]